MYARSPIQNSAKPTSHGGIRPARIARPIGNQAALRLLTRSVGGGITNGLERAADAAADTVTSGGIAAPQAKAPGGSIPAPARDALRGPGQKLEPAARAFFEPRFGRDFSGVRIHADAAAAASTRAVGARAYAVGERVAFGAGEYAPESSRGQHLLAHELAHVAQQGPGGARMQLAPLMYGNTAITLPPPPQPFSLQDAKDMVQAKITATPPKLTRGDVKGAKPGSDAEIFLWYILAKVADVVTWGSENDLIEPIGWAPAAPAGATGGPAPAAAAPTGAVTVRIDDKGEGVAELGSTAAVAPAKVFPDAAAAKAALISTYGLKSVTDGTPAPAWTPDELSRVAGAFAMLPAADLSALKGVDLKRTATVDPTHAAQFSTDPMTLAAGATTAPDQISTLLVGDAAFGADATMFSGAAATPSPNSYRTLVHEVGHAVASKAARDADVAEMQAGADINAKIQPANDANDAVNTANSERNTLIDAFNTTVRALNAANRAKPKDADVVKALTAEMKSRKGDIDVKDKELAALRATKKSADKDVTDAKTAEKKAAAADTATRISAQSVAAAKTSAAARGAAAKAALKTAQAGAAKLPAQDQTDSDAWRSPIDSVATQIDSYASNVAAGGVDADKEDASLAAAIKTRNDQHDALVAASPKNAALSSFASAVTAQDAWADAVKTWARIASRTMRVQKFVGMINSSGTKPFTQYAKDNWPGNPDEFYAEAYSLWRTNPEYLKTNAMPVFNFFENGTYLK